MSFLLVDCKQKYWYNHHQPTQLFNQNLHQAIFELLTKLFDMKKTAKITSLPFIPELLFTILLWVVELKLIGGAYFVSLYSTSLQKVIDKVISANKSFNKFWTWGLVI